MRDETGLIAKGGDHMVKRLTDLEALIMGIVWDADDEAVTVRYVYERIQGQRKLAYTTIMTVMGRLVEKKVLFRDPKGRAYLYAPLVSKGTMLSTSLRLLADQYFSGLSRGDRMKAIVDHVLVHGFSGSGQLPDDELAEIEREVKRIRTAA